MLQPINSLPQVPLRFKSGTVGTNSVNYMMPPDIVEISGKDSSVKSKKKGMSKTSKWLLGIGSAAAALVTAGILVMRHDSQKLAKLCKEKLKMAELPETIEFKEAASKEEAVKFAKEIFGIKDVDESFTLESLNWLNKALVDVSNANKGKIFVPTKLKFTEIKGALADANLKIETDDFGVLRINKQYFDNDFLTKEISDILKRKEGKDYTNFKMQTNQMGQIKGLKISINWTDDYKDLGTRFFQNPQNLSLDEKRKLYFMLAETQIRLNRNTIANPLGLLELCKDGLENAGIKCNYDVVSKLSLEEQLKKAIEINNEYYFKTGRTLCSIKTQLKNPCQTVYHEMGHLQDFAKNLETLSMKDTAWERFKQMFKNAKSNNKNELEAVGSRWLKITDDNGGGRILQDVLKEDSESFKDVLPDLYEHITNPKNQEVAGKVSEYAQKGVGEFIAEVYAEMIHGTKLSDDVLELYKKYNGPLPFAYK